MKRAKVILIWAIGIMFVATGFLKLTHLDPMSVAIFNKANYPSWLLYATGTVEVLGGIFLLISATRQWAVVMISVIMLGAVGTHFYLKDHFTHMIAPMVIMLLSYFITMNRKEK